MKANTPTAREIIKYLSRKSGKPIDKVTDAYDKAKDLLSFMKATLAIAAAPSSQPSPSMEMMSYKTQAIIDNREALIGAQKYPVYLDHGCGSGAITAEVRDVGGATTVYGVDIYTHPNIPECMTVIHPNPDGRLELADGSVDLITCLLSIHHVPKALQIMTLKELVRILSPTGTLLLYEHNVQPRHKDGETWAFKPRQPSSHRHEPLDLRAYLDAVHMTFVFYGTENENSTGNDPSETTYEDVQWIFDSTYHPAEWYRRILSELGMKVRGRSSTKNRQEMYFESFVKINAKEDES